MSVARPPGQADGQGDPVPFAGVDPSAFEGQVIFAGEAGPEGARWRWVHLKRSARTEAGLHAEGRLPAEVVDALLERDTLPRVLSIENWTVVILRAINRTHGSEPEDMISLRLAVTGAEVISVEGRRLRQIDRMIEHVRSDPPASPSAFLADLIAMLRADAEPVLDELEDDVANLERRMLRMTQDAARLTATERAALTDARQDAIQLHRYIAPQAMALDALLSIRPPWLVEKRRFRAEAAAFRRIAADLEAIRTRAQVLSEEASMAATERTNRIMLTLSVVSVVFLPIMALTGLLGVNLAGIPYAENPLSFWGFSALLVVVGAAGALLVIRLLR